MTNRARRKLSLRTPIALVSQAVGVVALLCGVFLLLGLPWVLLIGGALTLALGILVEGGLI